MVGSFNSKATLVLALGTVALGIVSLVALLVTHADTRGLIKQTRIASDQQHTDTLTALGKTDATITAMKSQAEAAVKSAGAAETALKLTKEQQRPVIWLNDLGTPQFVLNKIPDNPTGGQIVWTWHFTNYGRTPAVHMTFYQFITIVGHREESYGEPVAGSIGAPLPTGHDVFSTIISHPGIIKQETFGKLLAVLSIYQFSRHPQSLGAGGI